MPNIGIQSVIQGVPIRNWHFVEFTMLQLACLSTRGVLISNWHFVVYMIFPLKMYEILLYNNIMYTVRTIMLHKCVMIDTLSTPFQYGWHSCLTFGSLWMNMYSKQLTYLGVSRRHIKRQMVCTIMKQQSGITTDANNMNYKYCLCTLMFVISPFQYGCHCDWV